MIVEGLTQRHRATEVGHVPDPGILRVFAPSCEPVVAGEGCGWLDWLQWSGDGPIEDSPDWQKIEYVYDPAGRRMPEPSLVSCGSSLECGCAGCRGCVHNVRERDSVRPSASNRQSSIILHQCDNRLLRKYVHGPCIDQPICLIESSGDYAGTHYYHYDALGSSERRETNLPRFYAYTLPRGVRSPPTNAP